MPARRKSLVISLAATVAATSFTGFAAAAAPLHATANSTATVVAHGGSHGKQTATVQIYLTQHGKTILNTLDRVQGWSDSPLTEPGRQVATTVGTNLGKEIRGVDAAYSADMVRHYETATLILQGMRSKETVTRLTALREVNFGGFEGATNEEMGEAAAHELGYETMAEATANSTVPELVDAIKRANPVPSLPAENCDDVNARVMPALTKIATDAVKAKDDKVLVVSNGLTIVCALDAMGTEVAFPGISNGAVNLIEYKKGAWTVKSVNDTHYAQG